MDREATTPLPLDELLQEPAALLLRGGTILTMDRQARVVSGDLLIVDGRIVAIGSVGQLPSGTRILEVPDCLVLPGLVQGHIHLGQTLFRGLCEGRRLLDWLRQRIWPLEAAHDDESAYASALLGAAECLLSGTTTIQDIGIGPGAEGLLQGIVESGLRATAGMCLMDEGEGMPPGLASPTEDALAETVALGEAFDGAAAGRLRYVLNPRFILSCSDQLWQGIQRLHEKHAWPVHTHALEQREEGAAIRRLKGGRDEIEYFDEAGILSSDLRIAHGVWLTDRHLERVRRERFSVVHCPSANLKLGSGVFDLLRVRGAGVPVGLGCDGAPCNNTLDAFEEVRLAALLQHERRGPDAVTGLDVLRLATCEGARAIGLEDEIGSLEVGKRADVVVLAPDRPELWTADGVDPHDRVAYGASRAAVRHVLVDGELRVEDGQLVDLDLGVVLGQASRAIAAVMRRASPLS